MPHEKRLRSVDVHRNKKATAARFMRRFGRYFPHQICHCQTGAFRAGVSGLMPYQITQTRLAKASFCNTAALSCQLLNTGGSQSPEPSGQSFQAASSQSRQNCTATPCASIVKARVLSVAFPTPHPNFWRVQPVYACQHSCEQAPRRRHVIATTHCRTSS